MGIESKNNKEDVWRTWFKEAGGVYWTVPENMPEAARDSWNNYCHYRNNPTTNSHTLQVEAAKEFKRVTGFDAEEVLQFQESLSKK